jgi:hypothetical protein
MSEIQEILLRHLKAHIGGEKYVVHPIVLMPPHPLEEKPGPYWAIDIPGAGIRVDLGAGHAVVSIRGSDRWLVSPFGKTEYLGPQKRARLPGWLKLALKEYHRLSG